MGTLGIYLFGSFRLIHPQIHASDFRMTRSLKEILAYLLLYRHRSHSREVLASLFWGEMNQESARHCLNTALWRLRQVMEPKGTLKGAYLLTTPAGEVAFNALSNYWLDVAEFEKKVGRILSKPIETMQSTDAQELEDSLKLHTGDLLEGFYEDWVLQERERLHTLYLESLAHLMHYYRQKKDYKRCLDCGKQILLHDPLREEIHREVIKIYLESGRRGLALQQYQKCCAILKRELDIPPMEETQTLYQHILRMNPFTPIQAGLKTYQTEGGRHQTNLEHALWNMRSILREFEKIQESLFQTLQSLEKISKQKN